MSFKLLVGGYTTFITALSFSTSPTGAGSLTVLGQSPAGSNPSWIAANPTNTSVIYAAQENDAGQVLSFTLNPNTGSLTRTGTVSSGGSGPAYLAALASGEEIVVANYGSGSVSDILLGGDVSQLPSAPKQVLNVTGSGSHPHEIVEYLKGEELLVPDLGSDKVWRLTRGMGGAWQFSGSIQQPTGSGPRHIVPLGGDLYTLHETANTLTQQTLPPLGSAIEPTTIATLSILPEGASASMAAGELLLSPQNDKFPTQYLYATNRLDTNPEGDTIAIFSLNPLTLVKQFRTGLMQLRGAAIGGPDGAYLVAGGLVGGGVAVFERIDGGADLQVVARLPTVLNSSAFVFF